MAARLLAVRTWPAEEYTRVTLELDSELKAEHFTLDTPHRMVVDIQGIDITPGLNELVRKVRTDDPYISSLRVAQNRPNVVRIVFDLKQAIAPQVFTLKPAGDYKFRLVLDFYPKVAQDPLAALLKNNPQKIEEDPLAQILADIGRNPKGTAMASLPVLPSSIAPSTSGSTITPYKLERGRRVVTIALDPGHGGEDPGAVGKGGTREKDVVLAIAQRLKAKIDATPGMRAYLTRDGDYFVPLNVRVEKARRVKADLFVSIHADAFVRPTAGGSSVYVLSDGGASSTAARWLADKENAADLIGGINLGVQDAQVQRALLDMSTAAQIKDSLQIGREVLERMGKVGALHKRSVEQAGFAEVYNVLHGFEGELDDSHHRGATTGWRIARRMRSDAPVRVLEQLEDTPFYQRALLQSELLGQTVQSFHETLYVPRLQSSVVQAMLPWRMPRRN